MHLLSKNLILGVSVITITLSVLSLAGMFLAYWAAGMIIISEEQAVRRMMETGIVDQEKARALMESTLPYPTRSHRNGIRVLSRCIGSSLGLIMWNS